MEPPTDQAGTCTMCGDRTRTAGKLCTFCEATLAEEWQQVKREQSSHKR